MIATKIRKISASISIEAPWALSPHDLESYAVRSRDAHLSPGRDRLLGGGGPIVAVDDHAALPADGVHRLAELAELADVPVGAARDSRRSRDLREDARTQQGQEEDRDDRHRED